jgi:hypothetical protein
MYKNSALLSLGAALFFSLFCIDGGLAFQIDKKQDARILMTGHMNGTANLSTKHVSHTPNPCTEGGQGRTGAPGKQRCTLGSGAMAPDGSRYTMTTSESVAGILVGTSFIVLVTIGARRLQHPLTGITHRRQEGSIEPGLGTSVGGIKPGLSGSSGLSGWSGSTKQTRQTKQTK